MYSGGISAVTPVKSTNWHYSAGGTESREVAMGRNTCLVVKQAIIWQCQMRPRERSAAYDITGRYNPAEARWRRALRCGAGRLHPGVHGRRGSRLSDVCLADGGPAQRVEPV